MSRVYNFSAGPSMLPEEVLKKAQTEMLEYGTSGMSVMEMSHRSKDYQDIIDSAEALVRELMHVPDNYKVLFLQGGGSTQFAMIPLNLASKNKKADYVITVFDSLHVNLCRKKLRFHFFVNRRIFSFTVKINAIRYV